MKVLTLREPWASLIGKQIKTIETRSRPTSYMGELYIHAGLTKVPTKDERIKRKPRMNCAGLLPGASAEVSSELWKR